MAEVAAEQPVATSLPTAAAENFDAAPAATQYVAPSATEAAPTTNVGAVTYATASPVGQVTHTYAAPASYTAPPTTVHMAAPQYTYASAPTIAPAASHYTYAAAPTVTYASTPVSYEAMTQPAVSYAAPEGGEEAAAMAGADFSYSGAPENTYMTYTHAPEASTVFHSAAPAVYAGAPTTTYTAPTLAPAPFPAPLLAAPSMVATPNQDWFNSQGQFKFYADPPEVAGAAETDAPPATRDVTVQKKYKKRGCC